MEIIHPFSAIDINPECIICMDNLNTYDIINTICCKQDIHKKCIVECFRNNGRCPLCRKQYILKEDLENEYENYKIKESNIPSLIVNIDITDNHGYQYRYNCENIYYSICKGILGCLTFWLIVGWIVIVAPLPLDKKKYNHHNTTNISLILQNH
jgi:hypothetical protein